MTNPYTETTKNISDVILNEMQTYQFEEETISDNEYCIVPLDDNFLQVQTIKWVADGTNNSINLGMTLKSKEQVLSLGVSNIISPHIMTIIQPDCYVLNDDNNSIILPYTPQNGKETFYIKVITGLFFDGIQGGE